MTLNEARALIRRVARGFPHDEDVDPGKVMRAICVLIAELELDRA
jgi:hypothetical protein